MDLIEMLARRTAPPGTQFDLFNTALSRKPAAPVAPGPTLQQVIAGVDPRQLSLPLAGRNPPPFEQLEMFSGARPIPRAAAPAPVAPPVVDPKQLVAPLKGSNPVASGLDTRIPAQQVRAAQRALPQLNLFENPQERALPRARPQAPQLEMFAPEAAPTARAGAAAPATPAATAAAPAAESSVAAAAGKVSRFPRLANILSGAGAGPIMPLSLKEIADVSAGGRSAEQDAAMGNIRAAGEGVAQAWQQKGLDPTVKALFEGAKRIAFGAPAAPAVTTAAKADTSPMREGTLQELLATPAAAPVIAAAPAAQEAAPTNILSQMEQVARAYPQMTLRQIIALTEALPATSGAGAAAAAPSRGTALSTERAIALVDQEYREMMADPRLTPAEKVSERRRLRLEYAQLANVQAGLFTPPPEE